MNNYNYNYRYYLSIKNRLFLMVEPSFMVREGRKILYRVGRELFLGGREGMMEEMRVVSLQ